MPADSYRVLADLSYASLGYCGLAQESRLFLKTLWEMESVDPTGLIFSRGPSTLGHRFDSSEQFDRKIEDQALFLQALVDGPAATGVPRWQHLAQWCYRRFCSRTVSTRRLDNERFWDAIWRNLFARTLTDTDIRLARECPFLLANLGGAMLGGSTLLGKRGVDLETRGFDFAIFHNATPANVSPGTHKIVRYYDLIPGIRPDLVGNRKAVRNHFRDIRLCRDDSTFVSISESAHNDLVSLFPELESRAHCIPVILSDAYYPELQPERLPQILRTRKTDMAGRHPKATFQRATKTGKTPPYVIMASTLEPRKNYVYLIREFERLIARHKTDLCLVIVGNAGWKYGESTQAMKPLIERGRLFHLENVPTEEMRILYSHAQTLVFPSLYEGFGYTPLEAMRCHTPVIVSDIAAHRWVYGDAALYCDPYRAQSLENQIERLLFPENPGLRDHLIEQGNIRVQRYSPETVGNQWLELFEKLKPQSTSPGLAKPKLANFDEEPNWEKVDGYRKAATARA